MNVERGVSFWRRVGLLALCGLLTVALSSVAGCPVPGPTGPAGSDGAQGSQGEQGLQGEPGPAGADAGMDLPGTVITITDVSGASPVVSGAALSVTFTLETNDGDTIDIDDLNRFSIYVSGPADNYQRVIEAEDERDTSAVANADGSYTYTFAGGMPTVYAAPVNDSSAFGSDDGELTGQTVTPGTYTVGIEARQSFTIDGATVRDAGDATFDFAVDGATLSARQVVLESNCEKCHNEMTMHGSNRFSVTGCVLCHTNGAEDRISEDADKETPGVTVQFAQMIHKIHRGHDLPRIAATANGTDPFRTEIIGYGESLHDFSDVGFCRMPGGVIECDACHGGADQEDHIYEDEHITQFNCTSCHDDLNFTTGTILDSTDAGVDAGTLTRAQLNNAGRRAFPGHDAVGAGGTQHLFDDGACEFCHGAGKSWAVETVHQHETSTDDEGNGLAIEIVDVGGQSGDGGLFFVAGDFPEITFRLTDGDGNAVQLVDGDSTTADRVAFVVSGPTSLYQHIIPGEDQSRVRPWNGGSLNVDNLANWTDDFATDGTYTYVYEPAGASSKSTAWPAVYQAARNALPNQNFPFEDGWGQFYTAAGTPLVNGTYTVTAYARRKTATNGESEPAVADTFDVRFGNSRPRVPYADLVTDDKCNACHGNVAFHGHARAGVRACLACHTPGVQIDDDGTDNLDLRVMIHKIHNGRNLENDYILAGHSTHDYTETILPAMPGETKHCTACHATDAWKDVNERTDDVGNPVMQIWMVVCTSCHDTDATAAHAALNTDTSGGTPGVEACAVCHGDGAAFSVEESHAVP